MTSIPKDCTTCVFKTTRYKTPYCILRNHAILNLDIGCDRHMYKSEYKNNKTGMTAEEIQAAKEAELGGKE